MKNDFLVRVLERPVNIGAKRCRLLPREDAQRSREGFERDCGTKKNFMRETHYFFHRALHGMQLMRVCDGLRESVSVR